MKQLTSTNKIGFTPQFLTVDGNPWFPVMGEIHYSRVKPSSWKAELLKMKAGGVDLVSCYSIWIHHEEVKGEPDFTGCRDLRSFIKLVAECGLHCVLRIGPWSHGEVRNGGFPDWLVEMEKSGMFRLRSNDPGYLKEARRWYELVYEQVQGLFLKDGGPIIGVQIENEYGHCGGLTGEEGERHMRTLLGMAREIGYDVPVYTATGWGGAVTGGMLPVMGGYCEAPWDQRLTEIEPSGNYIFTAERNDHGIGSDYGLGEGLTFDMNRFPYLTAELGGGLQVTHHRRPVATADDTACMSMVKLGSGCNLLGYYMYHGGTNPEGKLSTLQESRATGYPNDLPVLSYDFNAPLREYGQISDTWRRIRMLSYFVHDFEDPLCRSRYIEQPGNAADADDYTSLRTAVRCGSGDEPAGFFFVNNYQRRREMAEHKAAQLRAYGEDGRTVLADFGTQDIKNGDYFFYPFNLKPERPGEVPGEEQPVLRSVNAVPLCILHGAGEGEKPGTNTYVFYAKGIQKKAVHYELEGLEKFADREGCEQQLSYEAAGLKFITLTEEEALHASRITVDGQEHLLISEADAVTDADGKISLLLRKEDQAGGKALHFMIYPDLPSCPAGFVKVSSGDAETASRAALFAGSEAFAGYQSLQHFDVPVRAAWEKTDREGVYSIHAETDLTPESALLLIDYAGNTAQMYEADGRKLIADNFYTGQTWEVELPGHALDAQVVIEPLTRDTQVFLEKWPESEDGRACRVEKVRTACVWRVPLEI